MKILNTLRSWSVAPMIKVVKTLNPEWNPKYVTDYEVEVLCHLISLTKGNIVEIGCNEGNTLVKLAQFANPRKCIGVDFAGNGTMNIFQNTEKPSDSRIGINAKSLSNVEIIKCDSKLVEPILAKNSPIGMMFIDGDHSWNGVQSDTEMALRLVKKGVIAWHDYNRNAPAFVEVIEYLDSQPSLKIAAYAGTNIGVLMIQ